MSRWESRQVARLTSSELITKATSRAHFGRGFLQRIDEQNADERGRNESQKWGQWPEPDQNILTFCLQLGIWNVLFFHSDIFI